MTETIDTAASRPPDGREEEERRPQHHASRRPEVDGRWPGHLGRRLHEEGPAGRGHQGGPVRRQSGAGAERREDKRDQRRPRSAPRSGRTSGPRPRAGPASRGATGATGATRATGSRDDRDDRGERADQGDQNRQGKQQGNQNKQQNRQQNRQDQQPQGQQRGDQGDQDEGQGEGEGGRRNRRRRGRDRSGTPGQRPAASATSRTPRSSRTTSWSRPPASSTSSTTTRSSGPAATCPGVDDVYLSLSMVRKYGLRRGDAVVGQVRQPREGERKEKFNPMVRIDSVNGMDPESGRNRVDFTKMTPLYPAERLRLETEPGNLIGRVIDLTAPIGKGQRGLIVSPAKAGKTTILQSIANSITTNNPECHLMVVLIDERPEEVTDFERTVKGEVIASTFDRPPADHTIVAELAIERAKRLVELGHDVVVLLDGLTRLGRAYNLTAPSNGRQLAGSVDSACAAPAQAVLRGRAQPRERRLADDPRHRAGGDRLGDRRGHLRGVPERRQHGAAAAQRPRGRAALPGGRPGRVRHPPRGAPDGRRGAPDPLEAPSGALRAGAEAGAGAARAAAQAVLDQHRVPAPGPAEDADAAGRRAADPALPQDPRDLPPFPHGTATVLVY